MEVETPDYIEFENSSDSTIIFHRGSLHQDSYKERNARYPDEERFIEPEAEDDSVNLGYTKK